MALTIVPHPTEAFAGHRDQALEVGCPWGGCITLGGTVPREGLLCESSSDGEVRRWVVRPGVWPAPGGCIWLTLPII